MDKSGHLTQKQIYNLCEKFQIGDRVLFKEMIKGEGKIRNPAYVEGKVVGRYPYHLVIGIAGQREESAQYFDIVKEELVKKKLGRKRANGK